MEGKMNHWIEAENRLFNVEKIDHACWNRALETLQIYIGKDRFEFKGDIGKAIYKHLSMGAFKAAEMAENERILAKRASVATPAKHADLVIPF